jgi:hypothetical protein
MNKIILIFATAFSFLFATKGKSQTIDESIIQTYSAFEAAKTYPQYLLASNQFKLIAKQDPTYWLANYYAAWSIAILSFQEPKSDNRDAMLDEGDAFFKKIELMDSTNDEVAVLGALLAQARLSVAPSSRHGKYGAIANAYFDKVKKINPNNPRMYYLQGNALFYTPKLFGGGAEKALPLYQKAQELFAENASDMMKDIHSPYWGKEVNEAMIKQCKEKTGK